MKNFAYFCVLALLTACIDVPKEEHTSFETLKVERGTLETEFAYSANIMGKADVQITPQVDGQLTAIKVVPGQVVRKGQVLFVIDDRQAQIAVQNASSTLQAAQAQAATAKLEMESNENLFKKEIVSQYMLTSAKNAYNQALAAVAQARSALAAAQLNLSHCRVTSPVNGVVGDVSVDMGQVVGLATVLTTIVENANVKVRYSITENEALALAKEFKNKSWQDIFKVLPEVKLRLKDGTLYERKGHIMNTTGTVDSRTGTITVEAEFPNPDGLLRSGTQGSVVIPFSIADVIVIPSTAVVRLQDKSMVYKVGKDSLATGTIVEVQEVNGKDFLVHSGLKPGDVIVAKGASNVQEKQRVIY